MNSDAEIPIQNESEAAVGPSEATRWPAHPWRLALGTVIGVAILASVAMLGLRFGRTLGDRETRQLALEPWQLGALCASFVAVFPIVLLAHELGHLIGGRLVGFRAFLLVIGPVRLERSEAGWDAHVNKELALYGGLAGSAPMDAHDLLRRTTVMVAGGPVASFALAIGAKLVLVALDLKTLDATSSFPHALGFLTFNLLAATSAIIGLATLIPSQMSGFLSDGARLVRLAKGGAGAARDSAIQALIGSSLGGIRPRDWDPALLSAACALRDDSSFEFVAWQFAQMHAADRGDTLQSLELLRNQLKVIDRAPKMTHAGLHLDAARQFALAGLVDEARAQIALAKGPAVGAPYLASMADMALLAAEGRDAEATALLPTIRRMLAKSIDRGSARWLNASLDRLQDGIAARQSATSRMH